MIIRLSEHMIDLMWSILFVCVCGHVCFLCALLHLKIKYLSPSMLQCIIHFYSNAQNCVLC
jgi:hypothetical protein